MAGYLPGKRGWAKRRTRMAFLSAAAALLREKDCCSISVIDICDRAGIPRATFYNYFEDKYDLVRASAIDFEGKVAVYRAEDKSYFDVYSDLIDLALQWCRSQQEILEPFFSVYGLVEGALVETLTAKILSLFGGERLEAEVASAAITYAAKAWTTGGCVEEIDSVRRRILLAAGFEA